MSAPALEAEASEVTAAADAILAAVQRQLALRALPEATYRLQFNAGLTFRDAAALVPYLAALGITHVYASPCMKAPLGSTSGYDIVDHTRLNPELGTEADYDEYVRQLRAHGMGQILDVVPNHMGVVGNDNVWWMDVLENGPSSPFAVFFDIDWLPLKADLANKVLLPVLGDQFGKVLESGQLVLTFEEGVFSIHYFEHRFPIGPRSSALILKHRLEELQQRLPDDDPHLLEYQSILTAIGHLPTSTETDPERLNERRREKEVIKRRLNDLCHASPVVHHFIGDNIRIFNGQAGERRSFDLLDQLLQDQPYRLAYWRVAADEINYRRFFDVNELAAICMENEEVFQKAHELVLKLVAEGKLDGLRIDHADGLYDPTAYLWRLQRARFAQLCQEATARLLDAAQFSNNVLDEELLRRYDEICRTNPASPLAQPLYVVVEKILGSREALPETWPACGTTGYEFASGLNKLFVDRGQARAFDAIYARFVRHRYDYGDLVYRCKKLIMSVSMSSEISVLGQQLDRISEQDRCSRDFTLHSLTDAIREVIACFPVYRTYIDEAGVLERDRHYIDAAVALAKQRNLATSASIFDFLRDILLLNYPDEADESLRGAQRRFVGRFQQLTGPVMAKGVEDTAFYIYNRLVSLNDVGGDPEEFGTTVAAFHRQNLERLSRWPYSLLATSTHDTKRSEDVRTRIDVLSETPQEWRTHLFRWSRWNRSRKLRVNGELIPSRNAEYLLYQTLIGTWPVAPMSAVERERYVQRIEQYMLKAAREAKVHTSWINPNENYERGLTAFIAAILTETPRNAFLADFQPFAGQIAGQGIWNSLAQVLLKLASPGVPDTYQGTELWDFSLVDPDNRRPVDFAVRRQTFTGLRVRIAAAGDNRLELARELCERPTDGEIKLFVISQVLNLRRTHPGLFTTGAYIPLDASGDRQEHVCAFARRQAGQTILVVVPRLTARLTGATGQPPLGPQVWGDTWLLVPGASTETRFRNVFTREVLTTTDNPRGPGLLLAQLLQCFPVALLELLPNVA